MRWILIGCTRRPGLTKPDASCLHLERAGLGFVAGTGVEDGNHAADRVGSRVGGHSDSHVRSGDAAL
ncbi:MAG TPA: hypothetical protein VIJ58_05205 [Candidatus Dormibacteraeota bacterium]